MSLVFPSLTFTEAALLQARLFSTSLFTSYMDANYCHTLSEVCLDFVSFFLPAQVCEPCECQNLQRHVSVQIV